MAWGTFWNLPLGLDPQAADAAKLPTSGAQQSGGNSYVTFKYRRLIGQTPIGYVVGVSNDLQTWDWTQSQIAQVGTPVPTGDGVTEEVTERVNTPISETAKKFLSLKVTDAP